MQQLFDISGQVGIVTGATGIISRTLCQYLAAQGVNLVLIGRNKDKLEDLQQQLAAFPVSTWYYLCDVTVQEQVQLTFQRIAEELPPVHFLINAAGGNMPKAVVEDRFFSASVEEFEKVMQLNLMGTVYPCKYFGLCAAAERNGETSSIINISSLAAFRPLTKVAGYSAAKSAVQNFTQWLAVNLQKNHPGKYRVNALVPGFLLTEQNRRLLTNEDGTLTERGQKAIDHIPFARFAQPIELAGAVHFLLSQAASYVNGITLVVDGGLLAYAGI